jgi:hypothetical protein
LKFIINVLYLYHLYKMQTESKANELYTLYFKCYCKEYSTKRTFTRADYIFNIENLNCQMSKLSPESRDYLITKIEKRIHMDHYYENFHTPYNDNLTPCSRKIVLENYPYLTVNHEFRK